MPDRQQLFSSGRLSKTRRASERSIGTKWRVGPTQTTSAPDRFGPGIRTIYSWFDNVIGNVPISLVVLQQQITYLLNYLLIYVNAYLKLCRDTGSYTNVYTFIHLFIILRIVFRKNYGYSIPVSRQTGNGPTMSIAIRENGSAMTGRLYKGAGAGLPPFPNL